MPRLIIDDMPIEVPAGTKVIDAAEALGIMIPRFCYHEGLGSVGACRMCAVKCLQGPFKGVQMSCMIEAQDGMVVSTTDEEAVAFRRQVIEWLMLNHPHDCPVCDEGGQCLLQDETISGGHGLRRFQGKKRTYHDQYLGELIAHEMNRCIHCYRCSRFYQDYAGYRDLGPLQIASRVYFGRFRDGSLESPFSGNLVDICPTGVYTDKPARFKARRWDLQRTPSVCIHCSLGCNTVANARYREVIRVEARFNEKVNGYFICDRGRFGFPYTNADERPRAARVGNDGVSLSRAISLAAGR
ncbi:MAG: 2Fe-2S iron-sulfur cluster binding domain-containing protein, partial [Syntrophobacteraceae bacterium]|nr:2Fe-2S iron-sulfur cluster binding domain-containing protein [Syntrophobacteraceae bacterium]